MSTLWMQLGNEWGAMQLAGGSVSLRDVTGAPVARSNAVDGAAEAAVILPGKQANACLLLTAAGSIVLVNGLPTVGIRILAHRDEVRVGRQQLYFSSERLVRPEPFAGADGTCCAMCRLPIKNGTLAVQCSCNLWFHQSQDSGCFLYADRCCGCEAPTAIDAEFTWSPENF